MQTQKDEVRDRILGAAIELFASRGYGNASIPAIAEAAGTAVGNIYRYFPSKGALLDALVPDELASRIEDAALANLRALAAAGARYQEPGSGREEALARLGELGSYRRELVFLMRGAAGSPREGFAGRLAASLVDAYLAWAKSIGAAPPDSARGLVESLYSSMLALAADAFDRGGDELALVVEYHASGMAALAERWGAKEAR